MEFCNLLSKINEEKNQLKSIDKFNKIKSKYILKKVFNNLKNGKALNIVKYNENIKKRININTNDYKEYSEKYSSIEMEIKPVSKIIYGAFINIKKEDEKYYHIYFNKNKKMNYINKDEQIEHIKIIIDYQVKSFENLFSY